MVRHDRLVTTQGSQVTGVLGGGGRNSSSPQVAQKCSELFLSADFRLLLGRSQKLPCQLSTQLSSAIQGGRLT